MTIQLIPNFFQIHCSQNVREAAKISAAISFLFVGSQLVPKYFKESETDKILFSNIFYLKQFISEKNGSRGTKCLIHNSLRVCAIIA